MKVNLETSNKRTAFRKKKVGVVVSNKANKSIVVAITTQARHPIYGKQVKKTTKLMAHDEKNQCHLGDEVIIVEGRPFSSKKKWRLQAIKTSIHDSARN